MKHWLTSSEIADLALPGLPETDRGIRMLAEREDWARFSALCRQRAGRGGGLEYHVNLLPIVARTAYFGPSAPQPTAGAALQAAPEPAGTTSKATLQLDARLAVLAAMKAFIRASELKQTLAISYFVDLYNLGKIDILNTPDASKEAALQYREDFADDPRAYLFHPSAKVFRGTTITEPASGRVVGLFIKRDKEVGGPFRSPSNQSMGGITGPSRPIPYYDGEPDSEANWLNQNEIATLRAGSILWGNRTCAADPLDAFVNVVRTQDMIDDTVMRAFYWALDDNLSVPLAQAILETLDNFGDELKSKAGVLGFRAWFDRSQNSNTALAGGILRLTYDREPAAPLEDLQFGARRNVEYYATLAEGILNISSNITAAAA